MEPLKIKPFKTMQDLETSPVAPYPDCEIWHNDDLRIPELSDAYKNKLLELNTKLRGHDPGQLKDWNIICNSVIEWDWIGYRFFKISRGRVQVADCMYWPSSFGQLVWDFSEESPEIVYGYIVHNSKI